MTTLEAFLNSPDAVPAITRVLAGETFIHADFLLRPGKDGEQKTITVVHPMGKSRHDFALVLPDVSSNADVRAILQLLLWMHLGNEKVIAESAEPAAS